MDAESVRERERGSFFGGDLERLDPIVCSKTGIYLEGRDRNNIYEVVRVITNRYRILFRNHGFSIVR